MADRTTNVTRSANYSQLYANNVNVNVTNWDFLLDFGKVVNVSEKEVQIVIDLGVYLGPGQAKALAIALSQSVNAYEQQFGEVALEPKKK